MPIEIGWLVEGRVSYYNYVGNITVEEIQEASRIGIMLLEQSTGSLMHTIQDNRKMDRFPREFPVLIKSVRESLQHPKMGWMLSVGIQEDIIRFVATLVSKVTRTRHRVFTTYEEAIAFLNSADSELPDLAAYATPSGDRILYRVSATANS